MIVDKYKCIYTNVPKTGSKSVKNFLSIEETHFPLYMEREKDEEKFNSYYKFAFVRNPWDRLVSIFSYLKKGGENEKDALARDKYLAPFNFNFHDFVMALNSENIQEQVHLRPQIYWVCEKDSKVLLADHIGHFEKYGEDWASIHSKLNIEDRVEPFFNVLKGKLKNTYVYNTLYNVKFAKNLVNEINKSKIVKKIGKRTDKLAHTNKSVHKHYKDYYDEETIGHVRKLYKDDIEIFNYDY